MGVTYWSSLASSLSVEDATGGVTTKVVPATFDIDENALVDLHEECRSIMRVCPMGNHDTEEAKLEVDVVSCLVSFQVRRPVQDPVLSVALIRTRE